MAATSMPRPSGQLPPDAISRCVEQVKIALCAGNPDQAHAAITSVYFRPSGHVDRKSPVADLEIPLRILNTLEANGVVTIGDLCGLSRTDLLCMRNLSVAGVEVIAEALAKLRLELGG